MTYIVTFRLFNSGEIRSVQIENAETLAAAVLAARRTDASFNHGNAEFVQVYRKLQEAA